MLFKKNCKRERESLEFIAEYFILLSLFYSPFDETTTFPVSVCHLQDRADKPNVLETRLYIRQVIASTYRLYTLVVHNSIGSATSQVHLYNRNTTLPYVLLICFVTSNNDHNITSINPTIVCVITILQYFIIQYA